MTAGHLVVGFDLDMTLIDSTDAIAATLDAAVAVSPGGEGVRITAADVWPWVGVPLEDTVEALAPAADVPVVVREYRARYASLGVPMLSLMPGALEALDAVRTAGGRVLVVSAKAEAGVHESLARVGLSAPGVAPDVVVGGLFAAAKGEFLREQGASVYVGDHPGDVEAALVAGAVPVALTTGAHDGTALRSAGAEVVLGGLPEFPAWLSSFLPRLRRSRVTR